MLDAYFCRIVPPFLYIFIMAKKLSASAVSGLIGVGSGLLNTGIQRLFDVKDKEAEQQWWYEQQKYLEEHNSPAYQSMKLRQAGLNPYTDRSSVPLGNVDSSLPRMNASNTFDTSAIQNSLLMDAQRENLEQDTNLKASQTGLNESKIETETEWRSNIIQQTLNLKQEYELGLINKEDLSLKLQEYKDALSLGYNQYLIDWDLKESNRLLNESLITLHEKEGQKIDKETLLTSVKYASATFELTLDKLYAEMERVAQLENVSINNAFTKAEFEEFLDTQDVRVSLINVQKAFSKLAIDEATRQDALSKITNEKDKQIAEQMLDAVERGDALQYWCLNMLENDPGAILNALSNIVTSFAPNINFSRSSSSVIKKTMK